MQPAQPVRFSHWLMSHVAALQRDCQVCTKFNKLPPPPCLTVVRLNYTCFFFLCVFCVFHVFCGYCPSFVLLLCWLCFGRVYTLTRVCVSVGCFCQLWLNFYGNPLPLGFDSTVQYITRTFAVQLRALLTQDVQVMLVVIC